MNKELIKQLKGVGFKERKKYEGCFRLRLKKDYLFDYYDDDTFHCYFKDHYVEGLKSSYVSPTFPQIIAAIKEHTGVDLTKKTKREEIKELKTKVASLEDAIKSQNDVIEANKKDAHRANDRLTMVLRRLKVLGVWKDEESNKQASEMPADEKKAFEAGDYATTLVDGGYVKKGQLVVIQKEFEDGDFDVKTVCGDKDGDLIDDTFHFTNLAPAESPKEKALEFGDPLECMGDFDGLAKGEKVVFLSLEHKGRAYNIINKHSNHHCLDKRFFKPL